MNYMNLSKSNFIDENRNDLSSTFTSNEEVLEIKCSDINENNVLKNLEIKKLYRIKVIDSNEIDLTCLLLLLKNPYITKIDINEVTIVGYDSEYLNMLLLEADFSKLNIKKANLNLPITTATSLLPLLSNKTKIGEIKTKFNPIDDPSEKDRNKKLIQNFEKQVDNLKYTIEYEEYNFPSCKIIKDIYINNFFGFFDDTPTNIILLDPNTLCEENFREYLQKYKGKKVLNVLGNMPISKRILEILDEELGEITLNVLGNVDIKPSIEKAEDVNYASIYKTSSIKKDKGIYTVIYKNIKIKNKGQYPNEIGYVNVDGIKDFAQFFHEFNEMTADCDKIVLKTSNKTIPNIESICKYAPEKEISVEYDSPYITSNSDAYNFIKTIKEQMGMTNSEECSLEDFLGMRETIDWIKDMSKEKITTVLGLIFFVYDFIKTFPYKENEQDKNSSRKLSSILTGEYIICLGYATLFSQILNELGIKSIVTTNDNHAYNIVKIDDDILDIHGLYRFDATYNNIYKYDEYLNKDSLEQLSEYFTLGSENFLYDMAFKTLSPAVTNFSQVVYPASNFEKHIIEYANSGKTRSLSLKDDLKYLFGEDYTHETVEKYVNTKEINKKDFLDGLIMGKELQGYTIEDVLDKGCKATELWEASKDQKSNSMHNNIK